MDKMYILESEKYPVSMDNYLGVEIEFLSEMDEYEIKDVLVKHGLEYNTYLTEDGSVGGLHPEVEKIDRRLLEIRLKYKNEYMRYGNDEEYQTLENKRYDYNEYNGHELRVLATERDMKKVLIKVGRVLKEVKAFINTTCGLHVHLDMRQRDPKKCFDLLFAKQDEMFQMVNVSRRNNNYCKKALKAFNTNGGERRRAINTSAIEKHNTIEIRVHEGTVDTKDITLWCKYLVSTLQGVKLTKELEAYVKSKINKNRAEAA